MTIHAMVDMGTTWVEMGGDGDTNDGKGMDMRIKKLLTWNNMTQSADRHVLKIAFITNMHLHKITYTNQELNVLVV